jgi:hypothetical protein
MTADQAYAKYKKRMDEIHAKYFFPPYPLTEAQKKRGAITPDGPGPRPEFTRDEYLNAWGKATKAYHKTMRALGATGYRWED